MDNTKNGNKSSPATFSNRKVKKMTSSKKYNCWKRWPIQRISRYLTDKNKEIHNVYFKITRIDQLDRFQDGCEINKLRTSTKKGIK